MVKCIVCGAEVETLWKELRVKVGNNPEVPMWTKVDHCPSCGTELLYIEIEPSDETLTIEGVHDGTIERD